MTVRELLNHFSFLFNRIVFLDKTNNIQDTAYTFMINSREQTIKNYTEFLNEYGEYEVTDWEVDTDLSSITQVYISIEIEEKRQ